MGVFPNAAAGALVSRYDCRNVLRVDGLDMKRTFLTILFFRTWAVGRANGDNISQAL